MVGGTVSLPGQSDEVGELQVWYHREKNDYLIHANRTTGSKGVSEFIIRF